MNDEAAVLLSWTARKVQPVVLAYVLAVFLAFIALAFFVFHSTEAVFALATTAVGSLVPLTPMVMSRVEYQFTEAGLRKRPVKEGNTDAFKEAFSWDEVARITPMKHGFKFFKRVEAKNRLVRFWKTHLSEGMSGEFQVEQGERDAVTEIIARQNLLPQKQISPEDVG